MPPSRARHVTGPVPLDVVLGASGSSPRCRDSGRMARAAGIAPRLTEDLFECREVAGTAVAVILDGLLGRQCEWSSTISAASPRGRNLTTINFSPHMNAAAAADPPLDVSHALGVVHRAAPLLQ
jgi:hypothetical protein